MDNKMAAMEFCHLLSFVQCNWIWCFSFLSVTITIQVNLNEDAHKCLVSNVFWSLLNTIYTILHFKYIYIYIYLKLCSVKASLNYY